MSRALLNYKLFIKTFWPFAFCENVLLSIDFLHACACKGICVSSLHHLIQSPQREMLSKYTFTFDCRDFALADKAEYKTLP